MKKGQKIKYENGIYCGKPIIEVGYLVSIDGDWAWVAKTKENCKEERGFAVPVRDILTEKR